jgi:hypothetical protein
MRTTDHQQIGLRVIQERVSEFRDLFAIADEGGEGRGELPDDACTIYDWRGRGHEYVVKDVVDRVPYGAFRSFVEGLRQLCSEFCRFCGVAGECFGLVVQTCTANGGKELLGLCQQ